MDAAFCGDVVANASWPCKKCTYVNDFTHEEFSNRRCGMCFTPRPVKGAKSAKQTIIEVDLSEDSDGDTPISTHLRSEGSKFDDELDLVRVHFPSRHSSESQKKHSISMPDNSYNVLVHRDCKLSAVEIEKRFDYNADIPYNEYHPSMLRLEGATFQHFSSNAIRPMILVAFL
jgi:hypothetical protein